MEFFHCRLISNGHDVTMSYYVGLASSRIKSPNERLHLQILWTNNTEQPVFEQMLDTLNVRVLHTPCHTV